MIKTILRLGGGAAACLLAASASAQDVSQSPNFGSATLRAGFTPDPHVVQVVAGGDVDASRLGNGCAGMISRAPDYRINYTGAPGVALTIRVRSSSDTTLVINTPQGNWGCNDDTGNSLNPGLVYRTPSTGQYDIWIGTFGEPVQGELRITEME